MEAAQYPALSKRLKIVYLVISLAILMLLTLQLPANLAYAGVALLAIASYVVTVFCLDRDLRREEWVVLPLYSVLAAIIYYTWVSPNISGMGAAAIAAAGFGLIMYGLLLTVNIINISTVRTIPLARPAHTILSLAGLVGSFGLFHLALINQPPLLNWTLAIGGSTVLIAWPLTWISLGPKRRLQRSIVWAASSAFLLMQLAVVLSFWPSSFSTSLMLSMVLFLILGIWHLQHKRQLNVDTKRQYLLLGGAALLVFIVFTQW